MAFHTKWNIERDRLVTLGCKRYMLLLILNLLSSTYTNSRIRHQCQCWYESTELGNLVGYNHRGEYCYSSIEEVPADAVQPAKAAHMCPLRAAKRRYANRQKEMRRQGLTRD